MVQKNRKRSASAQAGLPERTAAADAVQDVRILSGSDDPAQLSAAVEQADAAQQCVPDEVRLYPDSADETIDLLIVYVENALSAHRASKQAHQRETGETDAIKRDNCTRHADEWHKRSMESAAMALEYANAHLRRLVNSGIEPSAIYRLTYRLQWGGDGLDALCLEWPETQALLRAQWHRLVDEPPSIGKPVRVDNAIEAAADAVQEVLYLAGNGEPVKLREAVQQADAAILAIQERLDRARLAQIRDDLSIQLWRWWWRSDGTVIRRNFESDAKANTATGALEDLRDELCRAALLTPPRPVPPRSQHQAVTAAKPVLLTIPQATMLVEKASDCPISDDTIVRRVRDGTLQDHGTPGGPRLVSESEVMEKMNLLKKRRGRRSKKM